MICAYYSECGGRGCLMSGSLALRDAPGTLCGNRYGLQSSEDGGNS